MTLLHSEWASPNIIRIPFTLTGTLITVRARLDTLEGNFFFDTGASNLLLNYRYLSRPAKRQNQTPANQTGAEGRAQKIPARRLRYRTPDQSIVGMAVFTAVVILPV